MGGALLAGWLREGLDPVSVYVQDPTPSPEAAALMASHGIRVRHQAKLPTAPAVIVLAVKPQIIDDVLPTLASAIGPSTVLLVDRCRAHACQSRIAPAAGHGRRAGDAEHACCDRAGDDGCLRQR